MKILRLFACASPGQGDFDLYRIQSGSGTRW
jgi:hypothetical protein